LPFGFTMKPNKTGWKGGTRGCVEISGSPADSMRGKTYQLVIYTTAHALSGSASVPIPLSGYRIVMDSTLGISTFESNDFSLEQNTPNPFSLATFINFTSPSQENCQFTVYNILGAVVYCQSIVAKTGKNAILFSAASLPSGIYLYKLSNATQTITRRMIVEGR